MPIISNRYREPIGKTTYVPTGKDPPLHARMEEQAYWVLAGKVGDEFGGEPVTVAEIYHKVTGPLGLTSSDTIKLVRAAKKGGYLG